MKSLVNFPLFREQLKRFWIVGILSFLIYILFIGFPMFRPDNYNGHVIEQMMDLLILQNLVLILMSIAVPLVIVMLLFSHLFQERVATTVLSYPINKKQLWFTNGLVGFCLMALPLLLFSIVLLFPVPWFADTSDSLASAYGVYGSSYILELFPHGLQNGQIINSVPIVFGFFMRSLLLFSFFYSVCLLAVHLCGNPVVYVLLTGFLLLLPFGLLGLLEGTLSFYSFGYVSNGEWASNILDYINPILLTNHYTFVHPQSTNALQTTSSLGGYFASYLFGMTLLFLLSFWCNQQRKHERTGDSIVFLPIKRLLIFLVALVGCIAIGTFFMYIFSSIVWFYIGLLVGFVLSYYIAFMIAEKSFQIVRVATMRFVPFGACAVGLLVLALLLVRFDLIGIAKAVPYPSDVKDVYVTSSNTIHRTNFDWKNPYTADTKIIAQAIVIHKQIIADEKELRPLALPTYTGRNENVFRYSFSYRLTDGNTIQKEYYLTMDYAYSVGLMDLLKESTE